MKLNHNSVSYGIATVEDLELIESPLEGDTVVVTEEGRGGVFIYRADGTSNGGTIFDSSSTGKWHRQYEGSVNVKWFGAVGDGVTDDTVALQSAIDYCQANTNRTLTATKCTFLVSSSIHIGCYIKFEDSAILASSSFATNGTVVYIELGGQRLDGLSVVGSAYHISNNITGVNIGDCPSLRYSYNAHEICTYNLFISDFAVGLSISTFQNKYYNTVIVGCSTGISMYGISNSREINLNSFFGGNIRNCSGYALYLGDTRQPNCRTDGETQGSSNAFYDMQFMGSIAVGFVSSTNIHNCNFEYANYGNQIAINLYRTYELDIKNPFFNGYKYGVKEVRANVNNVSSISITTPTYNGVSICGVYTISDQTFVSYEGGTNIGSFGNGAEFHFGQRQITAGTLRNVRKLVSTSLGSIGVVPATDTYTFPRSFIRDGAYKSYEYISNDYVIKNTSTSIGGTLNSYLLTVPIDSVVGLTSGVYLTATSPYTMFGVISKIDYETGVIAVIGFWNATPVSTNTSTFKPIQLSTHFGSAAPTTGYYERGSKVYKSSATAGDFIGWVCTSSGTPGTWKTFGAITA